MIVYHEPDSLTHDLGFSAKTLYSISNRPDKHYRPVSIPKHGGGTRQLYVPDPLLKSVQRKIANVLLCGEPVSGYAYAYRFGRSARHNALPHVGHDILMKLDIRDFFGSITYAQVKEKVFPEIRYGEKLRILLTLLCVYPDSLPQGAPTSPVISNIIMRDFDEAIGAWCRGQNITYTRYCDDMTFSGSFDPKVVIQTVEPDLRKLGFFLNTKKTRVIHSGQQKNVTGIIVNEKPNVPAEYRKSVRQAVYYCQKYGTESHLAQSKNEKTVLEFLRELSGRINYILSVQRTEEFENYRRWVYAELKKYKG